MQTRIPEGWTCRSESHLLDTTLERRLAMRPRADLVLASPDARRVIVELEVSRADPVANQVKFLVAADAGAVGPNDILLCMLSPDIRAGKRNLTAAFARHLRTLGLTALTLSLLPRSSPEAVRRLNRLSREELASAALPVRGELDRVLSVAQPRGEREHRIHFAGDVTDVVANLWAWNDALDGSGADPWGRRAVQFFVDDPISGSFAPAKFCAFVPALRPGGPRVPPTMTMETYASLGERDPRFDGRRAWEHLVKHLGFELVDEARDPARARRFDEWASRRADHLRLRRPVRFVVPPSWYWR